MPERRRPAERCADTGHSRSHQSRILPSLPSELSRITIASRTINPARSNMRHDRERSYGPWTESTVVYDRGGAATLITALNPVAGYAGPDSAKLAYASAGELVKALADRKISSRELVNAAIARIEA